MRPDFHSAVAPVLVVMTVRIVMASGGAAMAAPPQLPDLAGVEPQVQAVIRRTHERVRTAPESAGQWGRYGQVLDAHTFAAEAARAYRNAGRLDPEDFRWPYLLAVLLSSEDPARSVLNLRRALELNDGYAPLHLRYAAAMESTGLAEAALRSYRRAVELDESSPVAHAGLGRRLLEDGDAPQAKRHLDRAVELDAGCRQALSALAAYYRRNGLMEEARDWAQRASEAPAPRRRDELLAAVRRLGVSTTQIVRRANELQDAGHPERGLQELLWLVRENPASVRGRNKLGEFYLAADDLANATAQYRAALIVAPESVPARLGLGHALTRADRRPEARREYLTVLAGHPSSVAAHRGLAICLAGLGEIEQASEHFARVLELAPDDRKARLACGSALRSIGQVQRALEVLMVMLAEPVGPDDDLALKALLEAAQALAWLDRYREAAGLLQRIVAAAPDDPLARADLAMSWAAAGDLEASSAQLTRVAALFGDDPRGRLAAAQMYARSSSVLAARGDRAAAIELLRRGLAVVPDSVAITNELAWALATSVDAELRNGREAVTLAKRAVELTGGQGHNELDTLAAAYARAGRFDDAVATAERALEIARRGEQDELASQIAARLELYGNRQAYHETLVPEQGEP